MSDSNHIIAFNKVRPGTPGAQPLNHFLGTQTICPVCGAWIPVTAGDVAMYISAHGQPQQTEVFTVVVGSSSSSLSTACLI